MDRHHRTPQNPLIQQLRSKLLSSPENLSHIKFEDSFLLKFLRSRNSDVNRTYSLIHNYFSVKKSYPNLFRPPSLFKNVYEDNIFCVLPTRGFKREAIVVIKPGNWDPAKYDVFHVMGAAVNLYEKEALNPETQIHGFIAIIDMKGSGWKHLMCLTPESVKLAASLTEDVLPIKFAKIRVVHQNRIADLVYCIASPFLSQDIKSKIYFDGESLEHLHRDVDRPKLPQHLGGMSKSYHALHYYHKNLKKNEKELITNIHHA